MINEENKTELIEQYLHGELRDKDLNEFKERMQSDPAFRWEVALQQKIAFAVREEQRGHMKAKISKIFQEEIKEKGVTPVINIRSRRINLGIAAAFTLLLAAGTVFLLLRKDEPETQLAYLEVRLPKGVRGGLPLADSLAVQIIRGEDDYSFHYRLGDTLNLYGDFHPEELQLFYDPNQKQYFLWLKDKNYPLDESSNITPLTPD